MKSRLFKAYRAMHEQAFVPVFGLDEFDSKRQVEACVMGGCRAIEYTLRKPDAREMIPWIRRNYPDLFLLIGSTLDSEQVVKTMRNRHPQLMTVAELAKVGVDGFVSMFGWRESSIRKYCKTHVLIPTAWDPTEALMQTGAGAHFQKILGPGLDLVKRCRQAPGFDFCPIFVTGGQSLQILPATYEAGAALIGAGFDVMFKGLPADTDARTMAGIVRQYLVTAQDTRAKVWPDLARAAGASHDKWLAALPHWHPF